VRIAKNILITDAIAMILKCILDDYKDLRFRI
jgi:hypothetical protein